MRKNLHLVGLSRVYVSRVCIKCMYHVYVSRLCITCMYHDGWFRECKKIISLKDFIRDSCNITNDVS